MAYPAGFNNSELAKELTDELGEFSNFTNFLGQLAA
jgi:hypothetical protein